MINTSQKGSRLERRVRAVLDTFCVLTIRSAGSKGLFDIMGFYDADGEIGAVAVQCKAGKATVSRGELHALTQFARRMPKFHVLVVDSRGALMYDRISGLWVKDTGIVGEEVSKWLPKRKQPRKMAKGSSTTDSSRSR